MDFSKMTLDELNKLQHEICVVINKKNAKEDALREPNLKKAIEEANKLELNNALSDKMVSVTFEKAPVVLYWDFDEDVDNILISWDFTSYGDDSYNDYMDPFVKDHVKIYGDNIKKSLKKLVKIAEKYNVSYRDLLFKVWKG